jgi:hypothetical protein
MDYAYMLGGGAPLVMKHAIGDTHANAGVVTTGPAEGEGGVILSTTTAMADSVGVTLDTGTFVTAQQTDGTSAERKVAIVISPDACFRALMSGGATEGTALTEYTISAAMTDGLTLTDSSIADWTSPDFDEGSIFISSGVNQGQRRTIISGSGSVATLKVAFDFDSAVDDKYMRTPWTALSAIALSLQSTTNLYQADATIAVATGGDVKIIDQEFNTATDSFVIFTLNDHALNHAIND